MILPNTFSHLNQLKEQGLNYKNCLNLSKCYYIKSNFDPKMKKKLK